MIRKREIKMANQQGADEKYLIGVQQDEKTREQRFNQFISKEHL